MSIVSFEKITPKIANSAWVAPSADIIGDVSLDEDSSVWFQCVLRGDVQSIRIGKKSNIQDCSMLHVTHKHKNVPNGYACTIGDNVTIGHKVMLHGCNIHDNVLVGMGAIILDNTVIEEHVIIGAGSLVAQNKILQSGYLYVGTPAKKIRALTPSEIAGIQYSADNYVKYKNRYRQNS